MNATAHLSVLSSTPYRLNQLFDHLEHSTVEYQPAEDQFSLLDILGHLIHGEDADWIPRLQLMLEQDHPTFTPFDRFAHRQFTQQYSVDELLQFFADKRASNLDVLRQLDPSIQQLERTANHPSLGTVTASQLLNCWVVHDLSHINQVNRVLSSLFDEVGPWKEYLKILRD